jgi:hypothetical protein
MDRQTQTIAQSLFRRFSYYFSKSRRGGGGGGGGGGDWWRKDRIFSRRILFSYLMEGRLWPEIGLIASLRMERRVQ